MKNQTSFKKGERHPMFGKHHTASHKRAVSEKMKGQIRSELHRSHLSISLKGKTLPKEVRNKIRNTLLGRKLPPEHRLHMSLSQKGKKSHLYKDGLSHIRKTERQVMMQTIEYKLWREAVFARDGWKCVIGGRAHGSRLNAHHKKSWKDFPKLRFAIDNGITLCIKCHKEKHHG